MELKTFLGEVQLVCGGYAAFKSDLWRKQSPDSKLAAASSWFVQNNSCICMYAFRLFSSFCASPCAMPDPPDFTFLTPLALSGYENLSAVGMLFLCMIIHKRMFKV